MQIDSGSEKQVLNGSISSSTRLTLMVGVIVLFTHLLKPVSHSKIIILLVIGGSIERWEDPFFRKCFQNVLNGNWRDHDPYSIEGRLDARSSLYGRPSQSSIFRAFQGWLAMRWIFYWRQWYMSDRFLLNRWWCSFNPVRPVQAKALFVFTQTFCSRMHTSS